MTNSPNFVSITVNLPGVGVSPQTFNVGLIIGTSTVISASQRVRQYTGTAAMLTDGFANNSPEYLAAQLYFSASPAPNLLIVGRKDLTVPETSLTAIQACRAVSSVWYAAYDTSAIDSDQAGIAAWCETQTAPYTQYLLQSSTSAISAGTGGNLFLTLQASAYSRSQGLFSASAYGMAGLLGYISGKTSNLAGSYYSEKFKSLPGVTPSTLTDTQISNIEGANGNTYVNRGNNMYEQGKNFNGQFFDEVLGLDMLANNIQINAMNYLASVPSAPQTEGGMASLRTVIGQACDTAVNRGFLAKNLTWDGPPVLTLTTGQILPSGYLILSDPISGQSQSARDNRLAPAIYVCINEAGAIHSVQIALNVNR